MAKLFVRVALCAALLALCGANLYAGGEAESTKAGPEVKVTPTEKGRECKIHVHLPSAEAKLYFDETLTKATGRDRSFRCPACAEGKRYSYKIVATWIENGREVTHETKITFKAGQDVAVDFRR